MNLIVNTRYNERRRRSSRRTIRRTSPTTIADPNSLLYRIGFRMRSRLHEMCEFLPLDGADYRELPAQRVRRRHRDAVDEAAART